MSNSNSNEYPAMDVNQHDVIGSMAGWNSFETRSNTPNGTPARPISAEELLSRIQRIESVVDTRRIANLLTTISSHIHRSDNPHGLTLEQLGDAVVEMLYGIYLSMGYEGSLDHFKMGLFRVFEIASASDIEDGINDNMLITVKGMRDFIDRHNRDTYAHAPLFEKMVPGQPPTDEPSLCWGGDVPLPSSIQSMDSTTRYTYIGQDGYLYLSETNYLPIDYTYGKGMVPCWETRTNLIIDSTDMTKASWHKENMDVSAGHWSIDKRNNGCLLVAPIGSEDKLHSIGFDEIVLEEYSTYTFSCYFKPTDVRFLEIRIKGLPLGNSGIALFDFLNNQVIVTDEGGDFKAEMIPSYTGMWRCGITWTTNNGITTNIKVVPYDKSPSGTGSFVGTGQELGIIWGAQLELGEGMSPFIYTDGDYRTREAIPITYELDDRFDKDSSTLVFEYRGPTLNKDKEYTLYRTYNEEFKTSMDAIYRDGYLNMTIYDEMGLAIFDYPVMNSSSNHRIVSQSFSDTTQVICASGQVANEITTKAIRSKNETHMDIGHNRYENYLNGYIRMITFYRGVCTPKNHQFLVGM